MDTGAYSGFNVEIENDGITVVTFDQPERMNPLTRGLKRDFIEMLQQAQMDRRVRVLIFTGSGKAFAAGGDLEEFRTARATVDLALAYHEAVGAALAAIESCPHPTIAAILGAHIPAALTTQGVAIRPCSVMTAVISPWAPRSIAVTRHCCLISTPSSRAAFASA